MSHPSPSPAHGGEPRLAEVRNCRLCGGRTAIQFSLKVLGKHLAEYSRCSDCGSLQTQPPFWLDEAYALNLSHLDTGAAQRSIDNLVACYIVAKLFGLRNAIDFGGGDGLLCRLLRDRGINCFVRDKYAAPTYAQGFTAPDFERPDLVIASEVWEHLPNPAAQLDELFGLDPQVLFATTDIYRDEREDWPYLAPESGQHVFFYSRTALERIAAKYRYALLTVDDLIAFVKAERLTRAKGRLLRLLLSCRIRRVLKAIIAMLPAGGAWQDHLSLRTKTPQAHSRLPAPRAPGSGPAESQSRPRRARALAPPSSSRAVVVGTVRDRATQIGPEVGRIIEALHGFARLQWLLVESDSSDGTQQSLAALASSHGDFHYLCLGELRDRLPLRTERIAFCRNAYLEALRSEARYAGVDFVIVADLDGVNSLLSASAMASCWRRDDWDACTANQRGRYYDVWALRHPDWSPNDCWMQYRFLTRNGVSHDSAWSACVRSRMIRIPPQADWIEVDSAFGGLAIYRKEALDRAGSYAGLESQGGEVCEHVTLHSALRAQGRRIFINPALINGNSAEHTEGRLVTQRMTRAITRLVKRAPA